ncbi:MAG TPA: hypothetical protein VFZ76_14275 [Anaerolineales bacterium]
MNENEEKREKQLSTADMVAAAESERQEDAERVERHSAEEVESSIMAEESVPLFKEGEAQEYRSNWSEIQTRFVDDPRDSVEDADELVAHVIKSIAETFAEERAFLEDQWNRGDEVSTEDLRIAMKRYRSFFNRLLSLEK